MAMPKNAQELTQRFHVKVVVNDEGKLVQYISPKDPTIAKDDRIWFSSKVVKELLREQMNDIIAKAKAGGHNPNDK